MVGRHQIQLSIFLDNLEFCKEKIMKHLKFRDCFEVIADILIFVWTIFGRYLQSAAFSHLGEALKIVFYLFHYFFFLYYNASVWTFQIHVSDKDSCCIDNFSNQSKKINNILIIWFADYRKVQDLARMSKFLFFILK